MWLIDTRAPSNVSIVSHSLCDRRRKHDWFRLALPSVSPVALTLVSIIAAVVLAAGCAGNCATNCPVIVFGIYATPGENLDIATAQLAGPACPESVGGCSGDLSGANTCVRMSIIGAQAGMCELDLTFTNGRAPLAIKTEFAAETNQGCCHGFPVIGPWSYTVPPLYGSTTDAGADGGLDSEADATSDSPADDADDAAPGSSGAGDR